MSYLDILVLYSNFMGFKKYQVSAKTPKVLPFDFTKKTFVHDENMPQICISFM
jgi:hypothetical protein